MDDTPFAQSACKILGCKWGAKITPLYRKRERLKRCVRDGGTSVVLRLVVKKVTFRIRQTMLMSWSGGQNPRLSPVLFRLLSRLSTPLTFHVRAYERCHRSHSLTNIKSTAPQAKAAIIGAIKMHINIKMRSLLILTVICFASVTAAADRQCQTPHDTNVDDMAEHQNMMYRETEHIKKEDLSLLAISSSSIHGRGVFLTRPAAKDTSIGILYYEVEEEMDEYLSPSLEEGFWHARGFITDGGKLDKRRMSVGEALIRCKGMAKCRGITFTDPEKLFSDPHGDLPSDKVDVEFKDKVRFGVDPENSWQSFIQHPDDNLAAVYFPLGCSSCLLPNPPPASLDPKLMLPCWPRYINHSCEPNTEVVKVSLEDGFVLPGVPWKKVVGAYRAVLLRDMDSEEELTLNYEELPSYMMRRVDGVEDCGGKLEG